MNNDNIPEEFDYDDGVVSFGTLTENQIERFKRLPRHTVLPLDIQLSQSFLDTDRDDHDKRHDQSIVFLNESQKNSTTHFDNMNCTTQLKNFDKERETGTIELKQSFVDESSSFSSPSAVKFFPSTKLLDTDVVNRYMHKKSISSNESLSEYQNTTTIEDESLNYLDDQESCATLANSTHNETEDCEQLSVLNVIDQRQIQQNIPDNANNICTLKPCSLKGEDEEEDISIYNDTELVNTSDSSEDSIIVEKYSVTPGKQRLYDVRLTKPAFHTKNLGTAAPFMDRIEETANSVPRLLDTPLVFFTSPNNSIMEINLNDESCANVLLNNNGMNLNKSLNETIDQIEEVMDATEFNFDTKESMNNISEISVKTTDLTDCNNEETIPADLEITSTYTSVVDTNFDNELCINKLSVNNDSMYLNKTNNQIEEVMDATEFNFDTKESMNNISEISVKTTDLTDCCNNEETIPADLEITSINTSVVVTNSDNELCINKLSANNDSMYLNKTNNQIEEVMDATEFNFDTKESMNNISEISVKTTDLTDCCNNEEIMAADLEIASTNTSVVDTNSDNELCINKLSAKNDGMHGMHLNKTTNQIEEVMDVTEFNFDTKESMNNKCEISVKTTDLTDCNNEETIPADLEITSTNTSVVDTNFDNELCINKLSANNDSMYLNKTNNQIEEVMDATEFNFDTKESMNNISEISVKTTDLTDCNNEETIPADLEITSTYTSVVDTNFDNELCINKLSVNNDSMYLNKTNNQIEEVMDATEFNFDTKESMNNLSEIYVKTTDLTDCCNNEETIPADLEITSINTSVVVTNSDNELCINKLSANNDSMYLNKTNNQIEEVMDATEFNFDTKESMNNICEISVKTTDLTDCNNEETIPADLEITSTNTSVVDTNFDNKLCINKLSANNDSMYLNKTNNQIEEVMDATEFNFDTKESMNNISEISVKTTDLTDCNNEETIPADLEITSTNTSVVDTNFDNELCINKLSANNDSMYLNKTNNQIEEVMDATEFNFDTKESMNNISEISVKTTDLTDCNNEETIPADLEITSTYTSVVDTNFDNELCINKLSVNNDSMYLNKTNNQIEEVMDATEFNFDTKESMNNLSEIYVKTTDLTDCCNNEETIPADLEITSINTSVVVTNSDNELCINKLSANNDSMYLNKTNNQIEEVMDATEFNFDTKESMNNICEISVKTTDLTDCNNEETIPADLEITSTNTSVVDTNFDNELCINKLSAKNDGMHGMHLNKTTNQIEEVMDVTEFNFDTKESMNNISEISVKTTDLTDCNNEETIPADLEITSTNTSVVDTNFDNELCINKLSANNDSMYLNKTNNQIEEVMDATEFNFDTKESRNNISEISVKTTDLTDCNNEETIPADLEITSTNTSVVDANFDNELCINKLSANNDSMYLNKTNNQIEEVMDATEFNFDTKVSMNNISEISVKTTDLTDCCNNEEIMAADLEIASTNTSVVDTNSDNELCINKLSAKNDGMHGMHLNKTTNQIEEVMDVTEFNFDTKESMNNISEISVKTTDLTDCNNEESIAADLEITSTNSNVMDTKFVDKLYNTVDNLKDTESKIDTDESLNNIYNINVDETSQSCELDNSTLKNITNIDISYAEEKNLTHSSENSVTNNGTLQNSSRAMRQFLDFEQTLYEICNPKLNDSTFNDSQTNRNISLNEQTVETYLNTSNENDSFCTSANPLESNLSVIIENRTLEENSSDLVMQNEEFENPINTVLENIVNENLDNIVLNESVILNNKESLVAKDILLPEVLKLSTVNEMENKTCESVMKSNEGIFIDNKVISSDEKMNEIKCNESCSISSYKFLKPESNVLLNKDIQSLDLLDETRNINNSLNDFMNMEQMFNFGENRTIQMLNLDTPKTQKILDFSIVPQTPIVENHAKKQKLLNFSIVDQTPISKDTQQKSFNNSFTKNNLSGINEILELETDSINKDYQNCINNSSSKNLSTISAPDTQSFIDISINSDNSIINQTLTETNLNESKTNTVGSNMDSIEYCMKESIPEVVKSVINCASNITLNKNSKKLDCSTILTDSDEKIITKSNKNAIVDFSIIEQPIPHTFRINNDTNITFVESKTNISNLIDSSVVSMIDAKSKGYVFDSLQNPTIVVSSDIEIETEKSLTSTLDYCSVNNSTTRLEQSTFSHNSELLTDVQMNDLSLFIESEKSSVNESFHSIELDHVKEDKKRKLEPVQDYNNFEKIMKIESKDPELDHVPEDSKIKIEPVQVNYNSEKKIKVESKDIESYHVQGDNKRKIKPVYDFHNSEKKMKVESEEPKTPISMLYKIKNMFKSNEKLPQYKNNTKSENRFNFNKLKDDKPEVLVKSKIPYKVTNTPRAQNDEFNNSKSLNDNKSKKGIPKFIGLPALSDLSNKTFPGQNSKFH